MELRRHSSGSLACSSHSRSRRARSRNGSSPSHRRRPRSSPGSSGTSCRSSSRRRASRCASSRSARARRSTSRAAAMRTWCSCTRSPPKSSSCARVTACERFPVMYNDFVIIGPKSDPAGIAGGDGHARRIAQDQERRRGVRVSRRPQRHAHRRGQPVDDGRRRHREGERPVVSRDGTRHGPGAEHRVVDERLSACRIAPRGSRSGIAASSRSSSKATSAS